MNELLKAIYDEVSQRTDWIVSRRAEDFYSRVIEPNLKYYPDLDLEYWAATEVEKQYGFEAGFKAAMELVGINREVSLCENKM